MSELLLFWKNHSIFNSLLSNTWAHFSDENAKVSVKMKADYTNAHKETLKK